MEPQREILVLYMVPGVAPQRGPMIVEIDTDDDGVLLTARGHREAALHGRTRREVLVACYSSWLQVR